MTTSASAGHKRTFSKVTPEDPAAPANTRGSQSPLLPLPALLRRDNTIEGLTGLEEAEIEVLNLTGDPEPAPSAAEGEEPQKLPIRSPMRTRSGAEVRHDKQPERRVKKN